MLNRIAAYAVRKATGLQRLTPRHQAHESCDCGYRQDWDAIDAALDLQDREGVCVADRYAPTAAELTTPRRTIGDTMADQLVACYRDTYCRCAVCADPQCACDCHKS